MIQNDQWIIDQCEMIQPMALRSSAGQISSGVSSFGYDIRVDRFFKVFVPAKDAIIDPKNFNPDVFVEKEGDYCIIPPNSFALAKSIERFCVPDDVLVVCVGKSTYARCFTGETKVSLWDGTERSFEELALEFSDKPFWVYSYDTIKKEIVPGLAHSPRLTERSNRVIKITLDNDQIIKCTPDHLFMLKDCTYKEAQHLTPKDSLMPLHKVVRAEVESKLQDVYDITVDEYHNFALSSGVFVHNCGIITNVTPLEPGWEGIVTLEISNTTPLPAKIYAGEGLVQALFFKGERPSVTYAEKSGKYQGQQGITLPKT